MKVFVTGATGYVGAAIVRLLLAEQHEVAGLVRSEASAAKLKQAGGRAVKGAIDDLEVLAVAAADADAVIHTAFRHDGSVSYEEAVKIDTAAIIAMTDAIAGTNKPFVMSSSTGLFGDTGPEPVTEEYPVAVGHGLPDRVNSERAAVLAAGKGVRSCVLRLSIFVWGNGGSFFIPLNLSAAKKHGKSYFILPGTQQTSGVHVNDMARVYLLAMKHAPAGSIFTVATSNNNSARAIAEAVGTNVGVPVEGISLEDACAMEIWPSWIAKLYTFNNRAASTKAVKMLGWDDYKMVNMLSDIATGSYVPKAEYDGVI